MDPCPEVEALTRAELVMQYATVERHRERISTGHRCWVERIPQPDGRVEVREYEGARLVSVNRVMPSCAPTARLQRGAWGTRLA